MHTSRLDVEWDPPKAASNIAKHGVSFADAVGVLEDPYGLTVQDDYANEERFATIGCDCLGRVLVVV